MEKNDDDEKIVSLSDARMRGDREEMRRVGEGFAQVARDARPFSELQRRLIDAGLDRSALSAGHCSVIFQVYGNIVGLMSSMGVPGDAIRGAILATVTTPFSSGRLTDIANMLPMSPVARKRWVVTMREFLTAARISLFTSITYGDRRAKMAAVVAILVDEFSAIAVRFPVPVCPPPAS